MCEPGDIDGFSNAVIKLLTDKELLKDIGEKSFEIIKNGYSLEKHIELIEEVYEELLA